MGRILIFIECLIMFSSIASAAVTKCISVNPKIKACKAPGLKYLGNEYQASAIFLGLDFNYHIDNIKFIERLLEISKQEKDFPIINILLPKSYNYFKGLSEKDIIKRFDKRDAKTGELYLKLMNSLKRFNGKRYNLIQTEDETTLWAQDLFEMHFVDNKGYLQNFRKKYKFDYAETFEKECRLSLKEEQLPLTSIDFKTRLYEDGGNFEMLKDWALIGSNLPDAYKKFYRKNFNKNIEIDVSWLNVGHVDELVKLIPIGSESKCNEMALLFASPKLGLSLLKVKKMKDRVCGIQSGDTKIIAEKKLKDCARFHDANKALDEKIQIGVRKIVSKLEKGTTCKKIKTIPLPVLFFRNFSRPIKSKGIDQNRFRPLYPNLVNSTIIGDLLLAPKQSNKAFQEYTSGEVSKLGLRIEYLDVNFIHEDDGAVHCLLNVARQCRSAQ